MQIPIDEGGEPRRWWGIVALMLLFAASVAFVGAYSSSVATNTVMQTGAAAAVDPFAGVALKARAAYVYDLSEGREMYALNPDAQLPLASLTKVPLALVVSQVMPPDQTIEIPRDTAPAGSSERLAKGSLWRLQDVITFTLVASSNEGAETLAEEANGPIRARYADAPETNATLWRMNGLARELNLSHTFFLNASGLDLSTTQSGAYGSAHDMARLFAYAASTSPSVFEGTMRDGLHLTSVDGKKTVAFNTNEAQGAIPGLIMGKTGYTDLAGGNLAVVFDIGPSHPIVAIVLGSTETGRFDDMMQLVRAASASLAQEP